MKACKKILKRNYKLSKSGPKLITSILAASFAVNLSHTDLSYAQDKKYSGFGQPTGDAPVLSAKQESTPTSQLVKQGLIYLKNRDFENAQKVFGAAAKLSPSSSTIHILNGLGYHLDFLKGVPESKSLAETAYEVASSMDQTDPLAIIQLGRLHIDSGEYAKASKDFVRALSIAPKNSEILYGLLKASLLQKDIKASLWAANNLKDLPGITPDHHKLIAITYSLAGQEEEAQKQFDFYVKQTSENSVTVNYVKSMLSYIAEQSKKSNSTNKGGGQFYKASLIDGQPSGRSSPSGSSNGGNPNSQPGGGGSSGPNSPGGSGSGANPNSQPGGGGSSGPNSPGGSGSGANPNSQPGGGGSSGSNVDNSKVPAAVKKSAKASLIKGKSSSNQTSTESDSSSDDGSTTTSSGSGSAPPISQSGMGGGMGGVGGGGGGGGDYTAAGQGTQKRKWFDCDVKPGLGKAPGGSYGVPVGGTSGDQTLYLEPLPSPCDNKNPPKMAMIDAVLIRTVETQSTSNGVNLLNGLQIFAGAQRTTVTGSAPVNASVIGAGLASSATLNGVSGLISYSMNIANSVTTAAQVVARPTLTAVDRIPSTFYSGQVQTIGLNGGGVSGAQVSNIPTGTSLSITPTFIDNESMMLAVKVSRSFVSNAAPIGGFSAGISTQNHAVTANVRIRYGETLVLDGLTDRVYNKSQNGVPILQDIPIIQYLFNNVTKSALAENVIVLVTPRRVVSSEVDMEHLQAEMLRAKGRLNLKELSIYEEIKSYEKLANLSSNSDVAIKALDQDSSFYRELKNHMLMTHDWAAQSGFKKFLNSVANTLYFN